MATNNISRLLQEIHESYNNIPRSSTEIYKGYRLVSEVKHLSLAGSFWSIEIKDSANVTLHKLLEESYCVGIDKAKSLVDNIKTFATFASN
jgi:hypothetical protein